MIKQKNNNELSIEEELAEYLAKNQPQPGSSVGPRPANNDLLSQIAAEDIKNEKKQKGKGKDKPQKNKKQVSFTKIFLITLMKITFFVDKIKFKYGALLSIIAGIWSFLVGLIYIGGLCSLVLLSYVYFNYPNYIKQYFKDNNIELSDWKINSYTFSKIELGNLKDKNKAYSIKKATIQSNFSDFLRKKIKLIKLEGVAIDIVEKGNKYEAGHLADLLVKINNSSKQGYHIGSIQITESILNVKGKKYNLPIQFSTTGFYENNTNVSIPLSIKQKYVNIVGKLTITGNANNLDWTLDIVSGNISLPNKQPENVSGQFKFKVNKYEIASVNGNLDLVYGKNKKSIKVDLKKSKKLFRGTIGLSLINQEVKNKADETKTELNFVFDGLDIKHLTLLESSQPIRFNIQSFYMQDFHLANASGILRGKLKCQDFACSYQINGNVPVNIQAVKTSYHGNTYTSKGRVGFVIKPNKKENLYISDENSKVNLLLSDVVYNGYKNISTAEIKANAKNLDLVAQISGEQKKSTLNIKAAGLNYDSSEIVLKNAQLEVQDIWKENTDLKLSAKEVSLPNSDLIKTSFALDMIRQNNIIGANIGLFNNVIFARFKGLVNLLSGSFQGVFSVKPIDLEKIPGNLNTYFSFIPKYIQNTKGKVSLYGNINWKNEKQIDGPFYLSMEDVGFDMGQTKVKGLNTVLFMQQFAPFVSAPNQNIFVKKIDHVIPLENTTISLKFDNQMARLSSLDAQILGSSIGVDNILMSYRTNSTMLYLKNNNIDLSQINSYLNIPDLTMTGDATLAMPIEIKDGEVLFTNGEVKLNNAVLTYSGDNTMLRSDLFAGGDEYLLKTGSIILSNNNNNSIDAYINLDGRLSTSQIKTPYKNMITLNPAEIINPMPEMAVPENIKQLQEQIRAKILNN